MTTFTKLPGMTFNETTTNTVINNAERIPLFLVQTSTAIASIDEQITHYTGIDEFSTIITGKNLTYTEKVISQTLQEYANTEFYVYSIKTDTAQNFTDIIKATAHLDDVQDIIYIEEAKSENANAITSKITAIKNGLADNANNGAFRVAYIIPYGTTSDAVSKAASGTTNEAAAIASLTTTLSATGNGRIACVLPDDNAGIVVGKCIASDYNDEAGRTTIESATEEDVFNFNATEMLALLNLGVLYLRRERAYGGYQQRICLGVTTSAKEGSSDGLLVCRTVVDELLRRICFEGQGFIKAKEIEDNEKALQSVVDAIVDEFDQAKDITRDGTSLTVGGDGQVFTINGSIQPVRSATSIEVNTTIE